MSVFAPISAGIVHDGVIGYTQDGITRWLRRGLECFMLVACLDYYYYILDELARVIRLFCGMPSQAKGLIKTNYSALQSESARGR